MHDDPSGRCRFRTPERRPATLGVMPRSVRLRPWQKAALERFHAHDGADFLAVATPGRRQDDVRAHRGGSAPERASEPTGRGGGADPAT
jgi:hypothetical protein